MNLFFSFTGMVRSPSLDTPNRDAVRLWMALGPGLCRVAATRHQVCADPCLGTPNRDAVRLWTALGPSLCHVAATRHQVCAYPCLDTPNRDAMGLWTALGPRLCRVAATRHRVCAASVRDSATLGFGGSEAQGIVSPRGRGEGRTGSSGTRPLPAAMGSANRGAALSCRHYFWQNRGHWACAHTECITFGRTEGTWRVPMQSLLLLAELKARGMGPCGVYYFWQN